MGPRKIVGRLRFRPAWAEPPRDPERRVGRCEARGCAAASPPQAEAPCPRTRPLLQAPPRAGGRTAPPAVSGSGAFSDAQARGFEENIAGARRTCLYQVLLRYSRSQPPLREELSRPRPLLDVCAPAFQEVCTPFSGRAAPTRRANAVPGLRPSSACSAVRVGRTPRPRFRRARSDETRLPRSGCSMDLAAAPRRRRSRRPLASDAPLSSARPRARADLPAKPAAGPGRRPCTRHSQAGRHSNRRSCMRPEAVMARRRRA